MKLQNIENPNLIADLKSGWALHDKGNTIDFDKPIDNLEDGEEYTVKELVGE